MKLVYSDQYDLNLGDHVFHPAGAAAVRIRFTPADGQPTTLTIQDADLLLSARRDA